MTVASDNVPLPWFPSSGRLLGYLVKYLGLHRADVGGPKGVRLAEKSARRYFDGERTPDDSRAGFLNDIATALRHADFIPAAVDPSAIKESLTFWANWWDGTFLVEAVKWPAVYQPGALQFAARYIVLEVAVRSAALSWLAGSYSPTYWVGGSSGAFLKKAVESHAPEMTRDELAVAIGVNPRTLDSWLDESEVPKAASLDKLVMMLATRRGKASPAILRELRIGIAIGQINRDLLDTLSAAGVRDLSESLRDYFDGTLRMLRNSVAKSFPPAHVRHLVTCIATAGITHPVVSRTLAAVAQHEARPGWKKEIEHLCNQTVPLRVNEAFKAMIPSQDIETQLDVGNVGDENQRKSVGSAMALHLIDMTQVDGTDLSGVNAALSREADKPGRKPLKAELLVKRAIELRDLGQHSEALTEFERAVQLDPDNANHRFHFGTSLGLEGDYERAREQLLKAIELSPSWDYPFCEISLHMAKQGNVGGALLYLRTRAAEFDGNSYQYHWTEGRLLHGLDRYVEALKSLERSVEIKPESAEAWNMASRVARLLLDRAKGLRYAKRAMHFGNRESYDRYFPGE